MEDEVDVVAVDTTWGELQRLEAAPGVRTVGELELTELVEQGALLVDSRTAGSFGGRTIPSSVNIPHDAVLDRRVELHPSPSRSCSATGHSALSHRTPSGSCSTPAIPPRRWTATGAECTTGRPCRCLPNHGRTATATAAGVDAGAGSPVSFFVDVLDVKQSDAPRPAVPPVTRSMTRSTK